MAALSLVPKRSLFSYVQEVEDIADLVDQLDRAEELGPEASEQLSHALIQAIAGTRQKTDRVCAVLAAYEAGEAAARAECDRLDARAKYFARQRERLEDYILAVLSASGLKRLDGDTSSVSARLNPPKLIVDDEASIPRQFFRLPEPAPPPEPVPDKSLIRKAIAAGAVVAGCRLVQGCRLVRS